MANTSHLTDYEVQRQLRLDENRRRMEELGLFKQKTLFESLAPCRGGRSGAVPPPKPGTLACKKQARLGREIRAEPRRSRRLLGDKVDYCEIGDNDVAVRLDGASSSQAGSHATCDGYHELLDLMDRNGSHATAAPGQDSTSGNGEREAMQEQLQQMRCSSQGRGSVYDSAIGITCHFCRQKKLCGEENCPRCQNRDAGQDCIGKTNCTRCSSAFGKFCRACLLIRYGQTLEAAREEMAAGTWLCPHCYEEEHPDAGWICNSSICMKRRGLKPTGIAIYDAQERGFKSVAHLLQSQLEKKGGVNNLRAAANQSQGEARTAGQAAAADLPAIAEQGAEQADRAAGAEAQPAPAAEAAPAATQPAPAGPKGRGRPRKSVAAAADGKEAKTRGKAPAAAAATAEGEVAVGMKRALRSRG